MPGRIAGWRELRANDRFFTADNPNMKKGMFFLLSVLLLPGIGADELRLSPDDMLIEKHYDGGYHLYIRKTPELGSVLITNSTADPERKLPVYALRNTAYHSVNGDEKRKLDGEFLEEKLYSLVDSTVENNRILGPAFHIFIPYQVEFGYKWTESGSMEVVDGTWLNIRAFEKPYADYTGVFKDNPFILRVQTVRPAANQDQEQEATEKHNPDTVESFSELAEKTGGDKYFPENEDQIIDAVRSILNKQTGDTIDLVIALDTTLSMKDDIAVIKKYLVDLLDEQFQGKKSYRVGLVLYKDYYEEYMTKPTPFQTRLAVIRRAILDIIVRGGRDKPEAVYEALHEALSAYVWENEDKIIILIGDAPPHASPKRAITKELVFELALAETVKINTIIIPNE